MIEITDLYKRFGKLTVLDGINLKLDNGGIHTILGPNGSGKTTLIKSILGIVIPNSGSINFMGEEIIGKWDYRNSISYMPQIAHFPRNLKVHELLTMIKDLRKGAHDESKLIEAFKLQPFLNKKLGVLSGGTIQKVNILITFLFDSPVLILDEPTTGLDPVALIQLKKLLDEEKAKGKQIIITTHIISLVEEISDEIIFILEGKIYFQGKVNDLKTHVSESDLELAIAKILKESDA